MLPHASADANANANAKRVISCDFSVLFIIKFFEQILQFSSKDGSTGAITNGLFILSRVQVLKDNHSKSININIINIKVPTDKCFEHSFSSIRTKMAELEPIEELELLDISNHKIEVEYRAALANALTKVNALAALHASAVPHANNNANDLHANANANANAYANANDPHANANANANANAPHTNANAKSNI
jgi:hypothetical protein